ncbi:hypothetical protein SAMN05519105_2243 [Rhodobacter sp. 24-YEA-8]|nr:hypothetical protein SAMN05519105_2243 [Rhodobacter sp. 24-YEA-8]
MDRFAMAEVLVSRACKDAALEARCQRRANVASPNADFTTPEFLRHMSNDRYRERCRAALSLGERQLRADFT